MRKLVGVLGMLVLVAGLAWAEEEKGKKEARRPPGGPGGPPPFGQILPGFLQEELKLTDDQKKQLGALQKEVHDKLEKILTADQKKQLKEMRERFGRPGGPGGPGGREGRPPGREGPPKDAPPKDAPPPRRPPTK